MLLSGWKVLDAKHSREKIGELLGLMADEYHLYGYSAN